MRCLGASLLFSFPAVSGWTEELVRDRGGEGGGVVVRRETMFMVLSIPCVQNLNE